MRTLGFALVALLLAAAPASAASVRVAGTCAKYTGCQYSVVYSAAPGERNVLSADAAQNTIVVHDAGAAITPGVGCVAVVGGASCTVPDADFLPLIADLGDGDDVSTADGEIDGGPGNDRLSGVGSLTGGPGEDVLSGAGLFIDGDGAKPAHDVYTGHGRTSLSYAGRHAGIRVDLHTGRAGEDVLSGIENAYGGAGADVLIGTDGPNELAGSVRDRLVGRGGDDTLSMAGHGRVDAGPGDDKITLAAHGARVRCGAGHDFVEQVGGGDDLRDCEALAFRRAWEPDAHLHGRRSRFLTNLGCNCRRASYVARAGGVVVAEARGHPHSLRLNARGRALLRARGRLRIAVRIREVTETAVDVSEFTTLLQRM
jgi:hypothetical protein